jgi:uncharacterized protein DUF5753/helix-turn-helix protein
MPRRLSTVRGRELGEGLRKAVGAANLNGRELAGMLGWDPAKLSDLLNGKGGVTELEVAHLLGVCRTPVAERDHLLTLYREASTTGWWQQHGSTLPIKVRTLIEHENIATSLINWQMNLIPGLLQTADYMRAVILACATAPTTEVEQRVSARLARHSIFDRRLPCTFYLHEQVLHLPVGGVEVLSAQLHHLLRMSVRPYLSLRVLPTARGAHAGLAGTFTWLGFPKINPMVFLESENASLFVEDEASIKGYRKVLGALDRSSLDEEESRRLISTLAT